MKIGPLSPSPLGGEGWGEGDRFKQHHKTQAEHLGKKTARKGPFLMSTEAYTRNVRVMRNASKLPHTITPASR
jgi:hypothetical protein